jgi:hypothetical protein
VLVDRTRFNDNLFDLEPRERWVVTDMVTVGSR